jgi:hypothetical protein
MATTPKIFVVSDYPNDLEPNDEGIPVYRSPDEAADAILNGWHGEHGTKYVLKVTVEVVAVATRPWEIRKEAHETGTSPEADEPTGPTDSR